MLKDTVKFLIEVFDAQSEFAWYRLGTIHGSKDTISRTILGNQGQRKPVHPLGKEALNLPTSHDREGVYANLPLLGAKGIL